MAFVSSLRTSSMRRYSWSYGGGKCHLCCCYKVQNCCCPHFLHVAQMQKNACFLRALNTIFAMSFFSKPNMFLLLQVRYPRPHLRCILFLPALHNHVWPILSQFHFHFVHFHFVQFHFVQFHFFVWLFYFYFYFVFHFCIYFYFHLLALSTHVWPILLHLSEFPSSFLFKNINWAHNTNIGLGLMVFGSVFYTRRCGASMTTT